MVGSSGGVLGSGLKATTTMGLCKIDRERGFELKATTIMAGDLLLAMMKGWAWVLTGKTQVPHVVFFVFFVFFFL